MPRKFQNYLLTIAANTCNNYFKKAKPLYTDLSAFDMTDETESALEKMVQNENAAEVRRALHTLPDYQKQISPGSRGGFRVRLIVPLCG